MLTRKGRFHPLFAANILLAALGCGSAASTAQTAGAVASSQNPPMTSEQRAGSVSYQMNTAVDALAKATDKVTQLKKVKSDKDLDKVDSLLYAAGESIGDYPNNPPTGKKGEDLNRWTKNAATAASSALSQIEQAEQIAKDNDLSADLHVADDSLKGAIQTSKTN